MVPEYVVVMGSGKILTRLSGCGHCLLLLVVEYLSLVTRVLLWTEGVLVIEDLSHISDRMVLDVDVGLLNLKTEVFDLLSLGLV